MNTLIGVFLIITFGITEVSATPANVHPAPNGIPFPANYADWRVISVSHRTDNQSMRVILGNNVALQAVRDNHTNPWPDGTILGKVVWKQKEEPNWKTAIAPDQFIHAEFMFRDSKKWAANGTGWGWARWVGTELTPYAKDTQVSQECIACHTPVKGKDWVYTSPALFPMPGS